MAPLKIYDGLLIMKKILIIGGGAGGLPLATFLGKKTRQERQGLDYPGRQQQLPHLETTLS
jgi:hypothetical protein